MYNGDTVCKDCVFAEYRDDTQFGCQLGRIEQFREKGFNVIEAYDNQREFYVVEDKLCNLKRTAAWKRKNKGSDLVELVRSEAATQVDILLYINDNILLDSQIIDKLECCAQQTQKPSSVSIILHKVSSPLNRYMKLISKYGDKFKWRVNRPTDPKNKGDAINQAVHNCTGQFYTLINVQDIFVLPNNFVEKIDKYINEELKTLAMILPSDDLNNGLTVNKVVHDEFGGNGRLNIIKKIQIKAEEGNALHLIKTYKEFFDET